ncbi:hypothetical protein E3P99_03249 [Wallemia hederae]|uniref:Purple acid phosphatase n=1 Tax=Wallemia hederae TaxID=1540922 RepID=A0A4T0FID9_9BASI|nr:hypothetical protein E3P99_03249 [Wallemia hederae]
MITSALGAAFGLSTFTAATLTYQHRLAISSDTGINVAFNTLGNTTAEATPVVYYGRSRDDLDMYAIGTSSSYATARSTTHKVPLRDLESDTQYHYQTCLDVYGSCLRSPTYSFKTAVSAGDHAEYKFAALGDMGVMGSLGLSSKAPESVEDFSKLDEGERSTMKALIDNQRKYQFILQNGDFAYADDAGKEITSGFIDRIPDEPLLQQMSETYELILEAFFNQTSEFARSVPYMAGVGNHEQLLTRGNMYTDELTNHTIMVDDIPTGQRNFTFYKDKFYMPGDESGGLGNFWWSVDVGPLKLIQLNTESDIKDGVPSPGARRDPALEDYGEPNEQLEWLENELRSVNRGITPWVMISAHRPWYGTWRGCPGCLEAFDELIVKYGVDVVYNSHIHLYERLAPLANGTVDDNELNNPRAPWYIVSGAAGHYDGLDDMPDNIAVESRRLIQGEFGYDEFTIHNRTHLTHAFVASKNDSVLDISTLYKTHEYKHD